MVTPAAELAFTRAAKLSPAHPAPPFFLGLAYYQMGKPERARELWMPLLAATPEQAPWRPMLVRSMTLLAEIDAAG
jgi:cytochrome c-type biogenesis protein CcmH/NrfG